ncbi:lysine N(6)-hydroxylase/L-ornithine N(5)-oxygenase family protein [Nocardioides panacisoli]|uniref:lysine N(6)-hydroxylase/L-ornithine N(5)-oxygenase family protein n=1 Tax=Nocardioides panacisoli TaxID=627624 RepID=UPI001C627256|nr:lysine N(6)-hydroxylase/L-ornithine N(5)-oxygenase family protein [Nocardioides panacisoli]QYJ05109.1 lysine N(6)-hydroxylase/L-ornithine N(5)-oxygenase family protein [Nocardioides panacisoli]
MTTTHDFVAIGLGPFNLGLACLTEPVDGLDGVFLEARDHFDWHPGMMLPEATLQVPFLADLVTMADPTSPYSFLNYLKETGRLYSFYIRESFYPLRREYNQYCQWAASRLATVRFGRPVVRVEHDGSTYVVTSATGEVFRGRRLVLGTGTTPHVPDALTGVLDDDAVVHSASYLDHRATLQQCDSIAVVGSGQSAAEVYADLLGGIDECDYQLTWLTRSPRFFPMEYTKLTLEMTSPEYTRYFQGLDPTTRRELLRDQRSLYKGISADTVDEIFDQLYARDVSGGTDTTLLTATEVVGARRDGDRIRLDLHHVEADRDFEISAEALVLATGYRAEVPAFLTPISDRIRWDAEGRYRVSEGYAVDHGGEEVYVQNGEEHTHGFVAPDLGMGAFRNSVIINQLAGREVYRVEERIAFQEFGVPERFRTDAGDRATVEVGR